MKTSRLLTLTFGHCTEIVHANSLKTRSYIYIILCKTVKTDRYLKVKKKIIISMNRNVTMRCKRVKLFEIHIGKNCTRKCIL